MPRIPYITDEQAGPPELVAAIRKRRGGQLGELDRLLQRASGYVATLVAGVAVYREGQATGALPGQLVRGPQAAPAPA